jgi:hypothetical protein
MESTIPEKLDALTPALPLSRDLLIDTGLGRTIDSQFHTMPGVVSGDDELHHRQ